MRIQEARRKETNEQVDDDYMCEDAHKKKVNILGKKKERVGVGKGITDENVYKCAASSSNGHKS